MIREFHLSPRGKGGISCDEGGAFVGAIPILQRLRRSGKDEWQPRDCDGLSEDMGGQYGLPIDMSRKRGGLKAIAKALNEGDVARAQIAAVLLGVPDPLPLSKHASSRRQMIELVRDLHWSGMLKWDPAEHPRWLTGSPDGKGGKFAPKGGAGDTLTGPDNASRNSHAADGTPKLIAVAEVEDERDPRFGIGGNHPPVEELLPRQLVQSPVGPVVQFLDNLLDLSGPGESANLEIAKVQMSDLLHAIHDVDPDYVYESLMPEGGLAGMSWQERQNVITGLQADLAAAVYRVRGDIRPLQEVTLKFMQKTTNDAYDEAVEKYNKGELDIQLTREVAIGNYVDGMVRTQLRTFYNNLDISMGPNSPIRVNRRAYDTSDPPPSYRVPDARVGNFAFDVSLEAKSPSKGQIRGFFNADFAPTGVVIVRPNQLGTNSSYIIWRQGED